MRRAFTLIEMTIVLLIIGVLSALSLSAMNAAYQQSKVQRTRAIIAKLDQLIMEKWESYRTRQVPIRIPNGQYPNGQPWMQPIGESFADTPANANLTNGFWDSGEAFTDQPFAATNQANGQFDLGASDYRLLAMRELQRMELPNLKADVWNDPLVMPFGPPGIYNASIFMRPSLSKNYLRRAQGVVGNNLAGWTTQYEGAECLYLIVAGIRDNDKSALDFFSPSEIGDVDGDGMNEILDSFGQPIEFVRWPLGYSEGPGPDLQWGVAGVDDDGDGFVDNASEAGYGDDQQSPATPQTRNFYKGYDYFDPLFRDGRFGRPGIPGNQFVLPIMLKPLVYSAGPDKVYAIMAPSSNLAGLGQCDPYRVEFAGSPPKMSAGSRNDPSGYQGYADNITNHDLESR